MLFLLLAVFLILAIGGGSWGQSRYGYIGWSPLGILLIIVLFMLFTGRLHL